MRSLVMTFMVACASSPSPAPTSPGSSEPPLDDAAGHCREVLTRTDAGWRVERTCRKLVRGNPAPALPPDLRSALFDAPDARQRLVVVFNYCYGRDGAVAAPVILAGDPPEPVARFLADEVRAWAFEPGEPEESCGLHMVSWAAEGANPQEEVPSRRLVAGEARPNLPIPLRMRLAKRDVTRLYSSLFHVCVDEQGAVTEVRKVAFTSIEVADYLREKVQAWRFDPGPATCTAIVFRHRVSG